MKGQIANLKIGMREARVRRDQREYKLSCMMGQGKAIKGKESEDGPSKH